MIISPSSTMISVHSYSSAWINRYRAPKRHSLIATFHALCVLLHFCGNEAMFELKPGPGVLYVCSGGALRVNCSTKTDLLEWNVTIPSNQRQIIKSFQRGNALMTTQNFVLNFSLTTASPLISTLSAENVTADINGTLITCSGFNFLDDGIFISASIQLNLVGINVNDGVTSTMNISERFEANSVIVTLEWTTKHGVTYNVNVDPQVTVNHTGSNSAQLVVPFNTKYNVSVVASLCGTNKTTFSLLNYVKCPALPSDHGPVEVEGYRNPAIEGTTITFSCPPGLILTGSNTASCMGNGKWQPDLGRTRCKVDCHTPTVNSNISLNYSSSLEDSLLTFQCEDGLLPDDVFVARCYKNGTWIPNPSHHVCATSSAANCGDPSPPSDGYLEPYTSTSEGAKVNQVHMCQNGQLAIEEIVCGLDGEWKSVNNNACTIKSSQLDANIIIGISLGSCFGVVVSCCVVLIIMIIMKWKGLKQRNAPISENCRSNERKDRDYQGEYSMLRRSFPVFDDNSKGEYSLLSQPFGTEKQLETNPKDLPTTLVYADVMSFKQKPHVLLCNPTDTRVEYAQLKAYSESIKTQQLTTKSPDMKSHPVDQAINLDILLIQLKPTVTDKWYQFGEAIGVPKEILEECTRYPTDQSLVEILDNWLRNHSGQPSWKEIAEALTKIGLQELSRNIKHVYETGKLPIEVDVNLIPDSQLPLQHASESTELPPPLPPRQT